MLVLIHSIHLSVAVLSIHWFRVSYIASASEHHQQKHHKGTVLIMLRIMLYNHQQHHLHNHRHYHEHNN